MTLTNYSTEHIISRFGIYHVVIVDYCSIFKGIYIGMCQLLSLNDDRLAKRNHKVLSVEHFLRYLNKDVTIAAEDQSTIMNLSPLVLL